MTERSSKICPLCCEPVHPLARKCPHCHHYLNKWTLALYHPLIAISPTLVFLGICALMLGRLADRGADFSSYQSQLRVDHSEIAFGETSGRPTVAVIGTIRNDSKISWVRITLEVQYFDAAHKLVDTVQNEGYGLVVPAGKEGAFKVSRPREFDMAKYASHEVHILDAREVRGIFW